MGIRMDKPLDAMNLSSLANYCSREMSKYRRKETCDDRYCLEIFRRAVVLHDNEAWVVLQQQYSESIRIWLGRHPYRESALRHEVEQNYIDDTFRRFWQAMSEQTVNFTTLAGALSYLRLCLHCAIMDTLRSYSRSNIDVMPEQGHPDEPHAEDSYYEDELWDVIKSILPGEKERRVAFLHFHCNLKPREIIRYCPGEFNNEDEIYRLKRNIMERIMRNADKIRWKLKGE